MKHHFILKVDHPLNVPEAANYSPESWPLPDDFPIVVDSDGRVVSRAGDARYDLTPWCARRTTIAFGDGPVASIAAPIDSANAKLFRRIVQWWLYGERPMIEASTVGNYAAMLRPLFAACTKAGIEASELSRFPLVQDGLASTFAPSLARTAVRLLHEAWLARDQIGFTVLDQEGLERLVANLPEHVTRQTPYIPPRIWLYQVERLRLFLDEFLANSEAIEGLFRYCVDAYIENYGTLSAALGPGRDRQVAPFSTASLQVGARYHGTFQDIAAKFGIDELIRRWVCPVEDTNTVLLATKLSKYFGLVSFVGLRYLINFSGMRREEALTLRTNCLRVEKDPTCGEIHYLLGETDKTVKDHNALWITSPATKIAVDALSVISRLRMECAIADPLVRISPNDISNPLLVLRSFEPWSALAASARTMEASLDTKYGAWSKEYPNLFDTDELRIRPEDLAIAKLVTPSLDSDEFTVGQIWPLADHQLRRTTAVNMSASGLVSDPSLQYQLKHLTRAQSLYYRQGFSRAPLNQKYQTELINAHYEVLALKLVQLFDDRYVSPFGVSHKQNLLKPVGEKEGKRLVALAKAGQVSVRDTLLGLCMKRGSCDKGGIDNIVGCPGCPDALLDKKKEPLIVELRDEFEMQLRSTKLDELDFDAISHQMAKANEALDVIRSN